MYVNGVASIPGWTLVWWDGERERTCDGFSSALPAPRVPSTPPPPFPPPTRRNRLRSGSNVRCLVRINAICQKHPASLFSLGPSSLLSSICRGE
ncbi:unnamed protein product [Tetraodon nigroviridis]|uniref:(spotted green pufferfish) hypothetical protein n=1 Tax=Tetraodon nigroviridis TaxID=99883 RepID=Q4S184_TETNG|nr:unnamed protein product [Tetraodon nigroviridis]